MALLPVDDAVAAILDGVEPVETEAAGLSAALGRVLSADVAATMDQPPFPASAMDGYAARSGDIVALPVTLRQIGVSAAGHPFDGNVGAGETVRIFTGAPVPEGADCIVIQENVQAAGEDVTVLEAATVGTFVREKGLDFKYGQVLLHAGDRLGPRKIGLAAAMNHGTLPVRRKPVVALIATGDELVSPGTPPAPGQIVSSNSVALGAFVRQCGGEVADAGILPDRTEAIVAAIEASADADVLITIGGASVGDHDLVQVALKAAGIDLEFWRIAMRPGKPLMFARRGRQRVLGLPGNPVSAQVCARIFLQPLLRALLGQTQDDALVSAQLDGTLPANGIRQDYVRATLETNRSGTLWARPFSRQDSSMQRVFAESGCLIVRPPNAEALEAGSRVLVLKLEG